MEERCGAKVEFRVAETPIFVEESLLDLIAREGAQLTHRLVADAKYLEAARKAIPSGYCVADETPHPHFLTADFALVRDRENKLIPRLVEIQAFPSVFAYQAVLCAAYRDIFAFPDDMGVFLSELSEEGYWDLLRRTVLGSHNPENVVLTEVDPQHQKTLPDFLVTARRLGITVVDIAELRAIGNKLHYLNRTGALVPVHRIFNRAIADELIAKKIRLRFDLTHRWDVEWSGHPNWYFLISKFSLPWLTRPEDPSSVIPPAAFLDDFIAGPGRAALVAAGVQMPAIECADSVYADLLLKPLFSFAGKGIKFDPTRAQLEAVPRSKRADYLLQQRMNFEPTIETPFGMTQAEIRILYMWPDGGTLTPALSLVRLGRGKMMGVDHNKNQEWVGGSAAFFPQPNGR